MKIDLGYSYDGPTEPVNLKSSPTKHYPTLHIDCGDVFLNGLPEEGEMTVTYKITSRNTNMRDGKTTCSVSLEIREINDVEVDEDLEADDEDSPQEALEKLAKLATAKGKSE